MFNLLSTGFLSGVKFNKAFDILYIFKSVISKWYLYLFLILLILSVIIFALTIKQPKRNNLSKTQKVAYVSTFSALCVVVNIIQIPTPMVQLSFVSTVACLAGVLLGPINGFVVAFLGDLLAGIIAPLGVYSPIIGIGTSLFGLVPGIIFAFFKGKDYIKLAISFLITYILSSFLLNTIGLSLIYPKFYVLAERLSTLPITFLFQVINCVISLILLRTLKRVLPKGKFYIDRV